MRATRRALIGGAAALPFLRLPARAARTPGQLVYGISGYPANFAPWTNAGASAAGIKLLMYRGLLSYDTSGKLRGELAESWERDGDSGWVFKLRDATFHSGKKVLAEDVKWTIEQVAAARSPAYLRDEFQRVERIETPDDRTVRLIMKEPIVTVPLWMASTYMPMVQAGSASGNAPAIGAGPFVMTGQERGVSLDFTAFDKYYRPGLPKLKSLRLVTYSDENLRVAALKSGDVDLIEYVPWTAMQAIEDDPNTSLQGTDGPFMYLTFNGKAGPFVDKRLRQAVAYAIKRDEVVKAAFIGRGATLGGLPIPASSPFFDKARSETWTYDPARAKDLMAQAGKADGFDCTLQSTAQYGMMKDTAEIVQQNLAAVGIRVTLFLPDMATRIAMGSRGQYEFAVAGTATDNNDPDGLSSIIDGSLPASFQRSYGIAVPELTALLAQGRTEFDPAKRKAIYDKVQDVAIAEASFVGLAWRSQGYAQTRKLHGFRNLPGALTFYSNLTMDEAELG